ncbi:hypothetical protein BBJ29_008347 [Phytophthora kernoviae]|uniref:CBS domain-containing protein n=1 Tax=Phytophthora kernoviae TaxID=325452 RepID=A0A3R7HGQ0_9STRA|nr:hypothetical protein BBJ29_008347 [Phytophthora kernoviae]
MPSLHMTTTTTDAMLPAHERRTGQITSLHEFQQRAARYERRGGVDHGSGGGFPGIPNWGGRADIDVTPDRRGSGSASDLANFRAYGLIVGTEGAYVHIMSIVTHHLLKTPMFEGFTILFTEGELPSTWQEVSNYYTLSVMAAVYMFLLPLCITLKIPTGIWVPTFIAGAAIGRMFGEIIATLLPRLNALPGAYALAGAAAYGTAATRAISVVVITLEITAAMSMILPLFCASLAAMAVSNLLKEKSVYDTLLVVNGMPFLPLIDFESTKTAGDIVEVCLVYLTKRTTIARVLLALQRLPHHEIPVVDDETTMVLLGVVSGSQLRRFVRSYYEVHRIRGVDEDLGEKAQKEEPLLSWATIKDKLTFKVLTDNTGGFHGLNSVDITYNALTTQGPHNIDHLEGAVPFLMDDEKMLRLLNEGWDAAKTAKLNEIVKITEGRICTIRPMAMTISSNTPLDDLHMIFTMLRCDHCFVCDHGALEGVVTTKGLLRSGKYSTAASELSVRYA